MAGDFNSDAWVEATNIASQSLERTTASVSAHAVGLGSLWIMTLILIALIGLIVFIGWKALKR